MAKVTNCIMVTCDHCQHSEYFTSNLVADTVGWEFDVKVGDSVFDLCPKCSTEWSKSVHNFIYGEKEDKNSIKIKDALDIAYKHGQTDGTHHKAWVIDQMVRRLLGDVYDEWVEKYKHNDEDDPGDYYEWDEGIAP